MIYPKLKTTIAVAVGLIAAIGIFWIAGFGSYFGLDPENSNSEMAFTENTAPTEPVIVLGFSNNPNVAPTYLADSSGIALYTTTKESCVGECLKAWPPYATESEYTSGPIGTTYRDDLGAYQYTWHSIPLYYYEGDNVPGDVHGDTVGGVWFVARP